MVIIPVLDLSHGVAVHARAGDRSRYQPVRSVLTPARDGDPLALLRAFRETLGAEQCYLADLDSIQGGAVQRTTIRELAQFEAGFAGALLVDAGTGQLGGALEVLACGASEVVVGLESLHAFSDLEAIVRLIGSTRVVVSLDLRLGSPILHPAMQDAVGAHPDATGLAAQAVESGVRSLLVLDIGRIGTGCGVDLGLLEGLRRRFQAERLLAGGGVLTRVDLDRMRDAGCDGVLVASALHTGRIGAADVAALQSEASVSR
jgi:phosphoribosylformimino-5-aminoimidazole carboxamide ribotide isomerase